MGTKRIEKYYYITNYITLLWKIIDLLGFTAQGLPLIIDHMSFVIIYVFLNNQSNAFSPSPSKSELIFS